MLEIIMENNMVNLRKISKVYDMPNERTAFEEGWHEAYKNMSEEIQSLKEEIEDLKQHKKSVYEVYVIPLDEYANQSISKFKLGCSIVEETIRRAKNYDTIKELFK